MTLGYARMQIAIFVLTLFEDLVGTRKQCRRDGETEGPRRTQVNHQPVFHRAKALVGDPRWRAAR